MNTSPPASCASSRSDATGRGGAAHHRHGQECADLNEERVTAVLRHLGHPAASPLLGARSPQPRPRPLRPRPPALARARAPSRRAYLRWRRRGGPRLDVQGGVATGSGVGSGAPSPPPRGQRPGTPPPRAKAAAARSPSAPRRHPDAAAPPVRERACGACRACALSSCAHRRRCPCRGRPCPCRCRCWRGRSSVSPLKGARLPRPAAAAGNRGRRRHLLYRARVPPRAAPHRPARARPALRPPASAAPPPRAQTLSPRHPAPPAAARAPDGRGAPAPLTPSIPPRLRALPPHPLPLTPSPRPFRPPPPARALARRRARARARARAQPSDHTRRRPPARPPIITHQPIPKDEIDEIRSTKHGGTECTIGW